MALLGLVWALTFYIIHFKMGGMDGIEKLATEAPHVATMFAALANGILRATLALMLATLALVCVFVKQNKAQSEQADRDSKNEEMAQQNKD